MATFIQVMSMIIEVIKILIPLLKELEALFPKEGAGALKLALAKEVLTASADMSGELKDMVENNWPKVEAWISRLVAIFNKIGW